MQKTLAMKLLEGKKIKFEVKEYPLELRDAELIAIEFGVPAGQVFKTLVVPAPEGSPRNVKDMLVMIPADRQLDLKKLAKTTDVKKLKMASHADAERITGLQVGGISALALLNRGFSIYIDGSANEFQEIFVSAGQRGMNILLPVHELIKVTRARTIAVCQTE